MSADLPSWLWYAVAAGVVLLAVAIAYGQWAWRKAPHDAASERARDAATRQHYRGK